MKNIFISIFIASLIAIGCNSKSSSDDTNSTAVNASSDSASESADNKVALKTSPANGAEFCSKIDIKTKVRSVSYALRECYERELVNSPTISGRVLTQWNIVEGGKVTSAKVIDSTLNNSNVEQCVLKTIQGVSFDTPSSPAVCVIRWPFVFSSIDKLHD